MDLLTVSEAAHESGLSPALIRRACQSGRVNGARLVGKTWTFTEDAFAAWYANRPAPGNPNWKSEAAKAGRDSI